MEREELERELAFIFMELETGCTLDTDQINTLKYACGFKTPEVKPLESLFIDFGNIFRSVK
jgi:hypothetical protein